jgi:hypothetical protein
MRVFFMTINGSNSSFFSQLNKDVVLNLSPYFHLEPL